MNSTKVAKSSSDSFIPADESRVYTLIFYLFARFLFWYRFKNIFIKNNYRQNRNRKTIYYLNHTSWWDGLIPLLLNRKIFRQHARAMMEDKQMRRYKFFRKLGAFSVNLTEKRSTSATLKYALASLERENGALYVYPEGEIRPFSSHDLTFENGLSWILKKCDASSVDAVPVSVYIHTAFSNKPELFIHIGEPVSISPDLPISHLNRILENRLCSDLQHVMESAFHRKASFDIRM